MRGVAIEKKSIARRSKSAETRGHAKEGRNMAIPVLIIGKSGTGKSASMRNCQCDDWNIIRVLNKPFPFRGHIKGWKTDDYTQVMKCLAQSKAKSIVLTTRDI